MRTLLSLVYCITVLSYSRAQNIFDAFGEPPSPNKVLVQNADQLLDDNGEQRPDVKFYSKGNIPLISPDGMVLRGSPLVAVPMGSS